MIKKKDPFYKFLDDHEKEFLQLCVGEKKGYFEAINRMKEIYLKERELEKK